jgi:hypothetical protein
MVLKLLMPVVLFAVLLAGCGGDSDDDENSVLTATTNPDEVSETATSASDSGNSDDFHACSLFTGQELGDLLGVEMTDGRDYLPTAAGATNCTWEGDAQVFVEVLLEDGQDWFDAIHIEGVGAGDTEEIDGIGDVAVWDSFLGTLDVVDGERFISVQPLVSFTDLDDKEAAIAIAEATLERLP